MSGEGVCPIDGVAVAMSRGGKLVHLDELDPDVEPHEVTTVVSQGSYTAVTVRQNTLAVVAAEMLNHHGTIHPASDCAFAQRLEAALRSPRT